MIRCGFCALICVTAENDAIPVHLLAHPKRACDRSRRPEFFRDLDDVSCVVLIAHENLYAGPPAKTTAPGQKDAFPAKKFAFSPSSTFVYDPVYEMININNSCFARAFRTSVAVKYAAAPDAKAPVRLFRLAAFPGRSSVDSGSLPESR